MAASKRQGRQAGGSRQERQPAGGETVGRNGSDVVKATIPSDFSAGFRIQQQILDAAARHGFKEQCLFAIKIAVEEALVNAIKHGNKQDLSKQVVIEAAITPGQAEIVIEDQGPGFDRTSVPDPLAEENLEKPSGRGILLIESYMTHVTWDLGGRRVKMIKNAADKGPGCTVG
jgi:serine/threonine-protein kinase RsbW